MSTLVKKKSKEDCGLKFRRIKMNGLEYNERAKRSTRMSEKELKRVIRKSVFVNKKIAKEVSYDITFQEEVIKSEYPKVNLIDIEHLSMDTMYVQGCECRICRQLLKSVAQC